MQSGDVYTATDLQLLARLAQGAETELVRFDSEDVIREAREMQRSLKRYVPGAVAEQLASGQDLTSAELDVTVLFVDIRGYTSYSESRRSVEVFSLINRYTELVSGNVRKHGGSVVEFNGDGMMAVFGAPRPLAAREQAAVRAGRAIVASMPGLSPADADQGIELSVGVGIASGEAYVGNIEAVDRMIWTAIGNTTNMAARLQSLTRELDASIVIDEPTLAALDGGADDFEPRRGIPIRGRRDRQDIWALPLRPHPTSDS